MRDKLIELLQSAESAVYWDSSDESFINKIADHLIANGVTFATDNNVTCKWVSVIECLPTESGEYLCTVIEPVSGGISIRRRYMLKYDAYEKLWVCENMIVTHWTLAPDLPKP